MDNKFQEVINLLKSETKNLDDNEMLSFNVSFVKDIIESLEEHQKENEKLKGFVEYLQGRNKDMVNINGWHMKTNKHLKERISELWHAELQKELKEKDEKIDELERVSIETRGLAYEKIVELQKENEQLKGRINKVTEQCAVNWINDILNGK